jgi:hypothetical protein
VYTRRIKEHHLANVDDLPGDFDANREVHYAALRQPLDPTEFVETLRGRIINGLGALNAALRDGSTGGVTITTRRGEPWIAIPKLEALPEPANLQKIKDEVIRRWCVRVGYETVPVATRGDDVRCSGTLFACWW